MLSNHSNAYGLPSGGEVFTGNLVCFDRTQNLVLERECRFDPDRRYESQVPLAEGTYKTPNEAVFKQGEKSTCQSRTNPIFRGKGGFGALNQRSQNKIRATHPHRHATEGNDTICSGGVDGHAQQAVARTRRLTSGASNIGHNSRNQARPAASSLYGAGGGL